MKRMKPFNKAEAYSWAASRCAQKEYCRMELAQKFMQRGLSLSDCNEVLDQLERERFIDEARYACAFVHDKTLYDRWGRMKTRQALAVKNKPWPLSTRQNIERFSAGSCSQKPRP